MEKPMISMIAAMGRDRTIGKDNKIPWDIPEDMAYLRETTSGKPLIMGRATYESVCGYRNVDPKKNRAMPGRYNVLVTRNGDYFGSECPEGVDIAITPKDGLHKAFQYASEAKISEIFVFGGAEIYKELISNVERLYLTEIDEIYEGDAFFPDFDRDEWIRTYHDQRSGFAFNVYDRKP